MCPQAACLAQCVEHKTLNVRANTEIRKSTYISGNRMKMKERQTGRHLGF